MDENMPDSRKPMAYQSRPVSFALSILAVVISNRSFKPDCNPKTAKKPDELT